MVKILADNADLENILHRLVKTVEDGGGWLNPNLIIVAKDRELSIEAENIEHGEKLIKITQDMLIPMNKIDLSIKNDQFCWEIPKPDQWSPVERAVTDITFEMFNMGDKARFHKDTNFWLNMANHMDTLDIIMEGRTHMDKVKKMIAAAREGFKNTDVNSFICDDFVKSRVLGVKNERTKLGKQVIMTIVDFMNHHAHGACFNTDDNGVLVGYVQPRSDTRECFAYYRPMDAFDSLLNYGFVDTSSNFTRSIPLTIQVPNLGRLAVKSRGDLLNKNKLAKPVEDLSFFMPVIEKIYDIVTASHLYIPGKNAPHALRRVLGVLIGRMSGKKTLPRKEAMSILRDIEQQIIEQNTAFYEGILAHLANKSDTVKNDMMLQNIQTMAEHQLYNIKLYKCLDEFNEQAA